ncbi:hypothetical protein MRX96_054003 [Rhipicephalus microplus]
MRLPVDLKASEAITGTDVTRRRFHVDAKMRRGVVSSMQQRSSTGDDNQASPGQPDEVTSSSRASPGKTVHTTRAFTKKNLQGLCAETKRITEHVAFSAADKPTAMQRSSTGDDNQASPGQPDEGDVIIPSQPRKDGAYRRAFTKKNRQDLYCKAKRITEHVAFSVARQAHSNCERNSVGGRT